ncbi:MAG: peptidylprolyl isomerase [Blastocatellia bacterium]|nr:peptidylprolyl isomerase [Blastocatellia bacterium]
MQSASAVLLWLSIGTAPLRAQTPLPPDLHQPKTPPVLNRLSSAQRITARLVQLEDQRNYNDEEFAKYFRFGHAGIRRRVALAVGRIGDPRGLGRLLDLMQDDGNPTVRAMAAFAVGEMEHADALERLVESSKNPRETVLVRGRIAEALGKIVRANPKKVTNTDDFVKLLNANLPEPKANLKAGSDEELAARLTITALLRIPAAQWIPPVAGLLKSSSPEVRRTAAIALARVVPAKFEAAGQTAAVSLFTEALKDSDPVVRSAAARIFAAKGIDLPTTELNKLLGDSESRVVVSAVRTLGGRGDSRVVTSLLAVADERLKVFAKIPAAERAQGDGLPVLLELATALGTLKAKEALPFLNQLRRLPTGRVGINPEVEVALAQIDAKSFFEFTPAEEPSAKDWQHVAGFCTGLGELASAEALQILIEIAEGKRFVGLDPRAMPDVLRALAKRKPEQLADILRAQLKAEDVLVRATAAELLADTPPSDDTFRLLSMAFTAAEKDGMNDAKLAILATLAKYNRTETATVLGSAFRDNDYLVRRQAADLLKTLNPEKTTAYETRVGINRVERDFKVYQKITTVPGTLNPQALVETTKGEFVIELFPEDAPLTVESFVTLAERNFFNGLTFHRVVPNFVIQGGDPRGDGNGGPGYQIRCEINQHLYQRGAVGMALSGKDTGGSQFFVCHSPQPHLDGGYTVFGNVVKGMEVVDRITRGDRILQVTIIQ